jgi:hypothetical protein
MTTAFRGRRPLFLLENSFLDTECLAVGLTVFLPFFGFQKELVPAIFLLKRRTISHSQSIWGRCRRWMSCAAYSSAWKRFKARRETIGGKHRTLYAQDYKNIGPIYPCK